MGARALVLVVAAWTGAGCDVIFGLHETSTITPLDAAPYPTNVMFVTSTTSSPSTWGSDAAGADAICTMLAQRAGLPDANLSNAYVAYIEIDGNLPSNRLGSARGWVRTDYRPFADTVADMQAGTIYYPPSLNEMAQPVPISTIVGAATANNDCQEYTSTAGNEYVTDGWPYYTGGEWQNGGFVPCTQDLPLYCFGITRSNPLEVTKTAGRRAFVSVQAFTPSGGLAGADAVCASDAQLAGLTGTFQALLTTSSAGAMSRFSLSGENWVRLDGTPIASGTLAFESQQWDTSIGVSSIGNYVDSFVFGADSLSQPSDPTTTCGDWSGSNGAIEGRSGATDGDAINYDPVGCTGLSLYCLEP